MSSLIEKGLSISKNALFSVFLNRAGKLLGRNLLIYGLGGLIAPFVGIKLIDIVISALGLA